MEICGSHEGVRPKVRWDIHLNQWGASDIKELTVFLSSDTILLQGMRTSGLMDNSTIIIKGLKRVLEKFKSIIRMKNLRRSRILSDNHRDEVGDYSDNLRVVVEKSRPKSRECNHQ